MQAMSSVYTLTDQTVHPFSGQPMPKQEHQRLMTWLLVGILVVAIVIGVWYWMSLASNPPVNAPVEQQTSLRQKVAALLASAPNHATPAEISKVAALLAKSKSTATDAERSKVADLLSKSPQN